MNEMSVVSSRRSSDIKLLSPQVVGSALVRRRVQLRLVPSVFRHFENTLWEIFELFHVRLCLLASNKAQHGFWLVFVGLAPFVFCTRLKRDTISESGTNQ